MRCLLEWIFIYFPKKLAVLTSFYYYIVYIVYIVQIGILFEWTGTKKVCYFARFLLLFLFKHSSSFFSFSSSERCFSASSSMLLAVLIVSMFSFPMPLANFGAVFQFCVLFKPFTVNFALFARHFVWIIISRKKHLTLLIGNDDRCDECQN